MLEHFDKPQKLFFIPFGKNGMIKKAKLFTPNNISEHIQKVPQSRGNGFERLITKELSPLTSVSRGITSNYNCCLLYKEFWMSTCVIYNISMENLYLLATAPDEAQFNHYY